MRLLLISPAYPHRKPGSFFPLGLAYVAASARAAGHQVDVIDVGAYAMSDEELARRLEDRKGSVDLVGTGGLVTAYGSVRTISRLCRRILPDVPQVVGGGLASSLPDFILNKTSADAVALNEGEETIQDILAARENNRDFSKIPGLWVRTATGEFSKTGERDPIEKIDALPFPAWDLFDMELYLTQEMPGRPRGVRSASVMTTRSCPYRCTFCYHPIGQKVRWRSPGNVADELEALVNNYGVSYFHFQDELFTVNRAHVRGVCQEILARGLKIRWNTSARVNRADADEFREMRAAGCHTFQFGIESGSDRILAAMKKDATSAMNAKAIGIAREAGFEPITSFILGSPGETEESIRETVDFIMKNDLLVHGLFFMTPYPRSPIFLECLEKGKIPDLEKFVESLANAWTLTVNMCDIPDQRLAQLSRKAHDEVLAGYLKRHRAPIVFQPGCPDAFLKCDLPACGHLTALKDYAPVITPFGAYIFCVHCNRGMALPPKRLRVRGGLVTPEGYRVRARCGLAGCGIDFAFDPDKNPVWVPCPACGFHFRLRRHQKLRYGLPWLTKKFLKRLNRKRG